MGTKQNFKTALNELMAGKITSSDAENEGQFGGDSEPVFNKQSYHTTYTSGGTIPAGTGGQSIISRDLIIEGNLKSKSDIRIDGYVKGNITCGGSIACGGAVDGDISCDSLYMSGCNINGSITARSDVTIDPDSTVIGDINSRNLVSSGRVKGDIVTSGSTTMREKAVFMGNIKANSIALDPGAALKGTVSVHTAELSDEDFESRNRWNRTEEPVTDESVMVAEDSGAANEDGSGNGEAENPDPEN